MKHSRIPGECKFTPGKGRLSLPAPTIEVLPTSGEEYDWDTLHECLEYSGGEPDTAPPEVRTNPPNVRADGRPLLRLRGKTKPLRAEEVPIPDDDEDLNEIDGEEATEDEIRERITDGMHEAAAEDSTAAHAPGDADEYHSPQAASSGHGGPRAAEEARLKRMETTLNKMEKVVYVMILLLVIGVLMLMTSSLMMMIQRPTMTTKVLRLLT